MPFEKDVDEKESYWCPKWYWPFAVCTRTVRKHKWCYQFAWVTETGYGVFSYLEGCENGKLFSWHEPSFNFFGSHTYPAGEMCFDSPRSSEGVCDANRTGMLGSGLSGSKLGFSDFEIKTKDLSSSVAETGTFDFTAESGGLCRRGLWPWKRVLREQEIAVSVTLNGVSAQWFVGGMPVTGPAGTLSISASCKWPFPLPKGRHENKVVQVSYTMTTTATKSTLRLLNRPDDGAYNVSIGMKAILNGTELNSSYTYARFSGETCDFDPAKFKEMGECLRRFRDATRQKVEFKRPKPGEPVIIVFDEIWNLIREDRKEVVESLLEIMNDTLRNDPQAHTQAMNQLEQETGLADLSRMIRIGPAAAEHGMPKRMPNPALIAGVALGLALLVGKFIASLGRKK